MDKENISYRSHISLIIFHHNRYMYTEKANKPDPVAAMVLATIFGPADLFSDT